MRLLGEVGVDGERVEDADDKGGGEEGVAVEMGVGVGGVEGVEGEGLFVDGGELFDYRAFAGAEDIDVADGKRGVVSVGDASAV